MLQEVKPQLGELHFCVTIDKIPEAVKANKSIKIQKGDLELEVTKDQKYYFLTKLLLTRLWVQNTLGSAIYIYMNDINKLFFELIQVALGVRTCLSHYPTAEEWKVLYDIAKKQSIVGVCFAGVQRLGAGGTETSETLQTSWNLPEILYLQWMGLAAKIQQRNEVMNKHTAKTLEYFRAHVFPCCVLKGQGVAKLYGQLAGLRQSGDIDVWVNSSRKELYEFAKKELGNITGLTYHHIHYEMFPDVEIEAHTWPAFFTSPIHNKRFQKFCLQNVPNDGCSDYASLAFNRVFIIQHCYGHFCGHGVGFRQLLDYYFVLEQGFTEIERSESMRWIERLGMGRFAAALMWLCVEVFGMDISLCICKPNEKDGKFLLAEVLQTGNMGRQDERVDYKKLQNALGRYLYNIKRDWQIMRIAPGYALWEPVWGVYQFVWCRLLKLKYN